MTSIVYNRPAIVNAYLKQKEFVDCQETFVIVEASTKAGKTTGCIVKIFESGLEGVDGDNFWWVAPVQATAKIAFRRLKRYISNKDLFIANKVDSTITFKHNNTTIWFKSADNPDSLYGDDVQGVVIDEGTRVSEEAWHAIYSTLTYTNGWCRIIGNTKGVNNWVYKLILRIQEGKLPSDLWRHFKITADDAVAAGVLTRQKIDQAKNTLPSRVFQELYYCIPDKNSSNKFCYSFDEDKHVAKCPEWRRDMITYLSFDFNKNPICCNVIQHYNNHIYVLESIKLENSDIYKLCEVISIKYPGAVFAVCGDASGRAGSALVKDNMNYFKAIKTQLRLNTAQMQQLSVNPPIEENQVLVNAILEHYPLTIDIDKAQPLIFDCKFVEMDASGKIKKGDRDDPTQQADSLDCFRYYLNRYHKDFIKRFYQ